MPTQNQAFIDKAVTAATLGLVPQNFVSNRILTPLPVQQSTGVIAGYDNNHLRIENTLTGGKNKYPEIEVNQRTTTAYSIEEHGLAGIVTELDRKNFGDSPFDAAVDTSVQLTTQIMLAKEYGLASTLTNLSVMTQNTTLAGTDQWSDFANSTPLADMSAARNAIQEKIGMLPNKALMSARVYNILRFHPDLISSLGFKDAGIGRSLSQEQLAAALDVEEVIVGQAIYNNSKQGQTDSIAQIWGNDFIFIHAPSTGSRRMTTLGFDCFFQDWGQDASVFRNAVTNPPNAEEVLTRMGYDQLLTNVNAAYLIKDAVAAAA